MGVEPKGVKAPFASAGPYYVVSWTPNVRLVLKRNPHYKRNRDRDAYPLRYSEASLRKAKQLMRGLTVKAKLLAGNRGSNLTIPQIVKFNLAKIGIDVETRHLASGPLAALGGSRGEPFEFFLSGWQADYPDPNRS
jgi:ABC-type oligopeptide transport system substrate-binding subunit